MLFEIKLKYLNIQCLDYHVVGSILTLIFNIILVHLIFEMKNQTFSHQQNIWIVTNYGLQLWKSNG